MLVGGQINSRMFMKKILLFILCFLFTNVYSHTHFLYKNIYTLPLIHKIPKIIHHIWVGKKEISEEYKHYMDTWRIIHPDWEHKLWTDEDIEDFPWQNKALFLKSTNPGMKSDIWRYEILYNYGGLYVDTDMECIRSFDPIHERLEFYAGFDSKKKYIVANCLIAAAPKSTILKKMITFLSKNTNSIDIPSLTFDDIQTITGPGLLTKGAKNLKPLSLENPILIFSNEYFQPVSCANHGIPKTAEEQYNVVTCCFAIHHNGGSWLK